jgi:hypothetical protein
MSIHSRNEEVILQFGLKKPAFRIVVNTPTTHGSIGLTTGLDPAMTLGCGGYGGNITSDNISPRHLLNVKRLAYEVRPAVVQKTKAAESPISRALPKVAAQPAAAGISADALSRRVDDFLASRGFRSGSVGDAPQPPATPTTSGATAPAAGAQRPAEFVCEEDVRQAVRRGTKITVGERTIITPAARDMGEQHKIFVQGSWPKFA